MSAPTEPSDTGVTPRSHRARRIAVGVLVLAIIAVASTSNIWLRILRDGAGQDPVAGATEIVLQDDWFTPSVVQVPVGSTVTFLWDDDGTAHDVAFDDGIASDVQTDGSYQRTFDDAGDLRFVCTLHPGMNGRVIVTDDPDAAG